MAPASGDLAEAARVFFAPPLVFKPVVIGGRTLTDGGMTETAARWGRHAEPARLGDHVGARSDHPPDADYDAVGCCS